MLSALQHPSWPNKSNFHSSLWFTSRKWSILLLSDAIVQDVGSSATYGNKSVSSDEGAYIIPSAMIRTDGYILAWEYLASKNGSIRIQVRSTKYPIAETKLIIILVEIPLRWYIVGLGESNKKKLTLLEIVYSLRVGLSCRDFQISIEKNFANRLSICWWLELVRNYVAIFSTMELKAAKTTYTDLRIKRGYHQHGIEFGVGITIVNWQIADKGNN